MGKYIDADLLAKAMKPEEWNTPDEKWWPEREIGALIDALPAADVAEVRHGRWEYNDEAYVGSNPYGSYNCSVCGENVPHKTDYCLNCGARMDEVTE